MSKYKNIEPLVARDVGVLISLIKELVPVSEERLMAQLDATLSSASFRAPEVQGDTWDELQAILMQRLVPPLKQEWQIKVISLFTEESEEEVRKKYTEWPDNPLEG